MHVSVVRIVFHRSRCCMECNEMRIPQCYLIHPSSQPLWKKDWKMHQRSAETFPLPPGTARLSSASSFHQMLNPGMPWTSQWFQQRIGNPLASLLKTFSYFFWTVVDDNGYPSLADKKEFWILDTKFTVRNENSHAQKIPKVIKKIKAVILYVYETIVVTKQNSV